MNHSQSPPPRSWEVLLLGGASGTGKTSVSYRLAHHFQIGITEVDDFQVVLERMTTPEQQPVLHYWNVHPEAQRLPAAGILDLHLAVGQVMAPALEAVIANHLESNAPIVLEGDFILPALAAQTAFAGIANTGRVRAVFLYEPDEAQIVDNFLQREPESGPQFGRARVCRLFGEWLKREGEQRGLIALPARPWESLFDRILHAIA